MKKLMWLISILPLVITAIVLPFLPDSVPLHYDFAGSIDRWGSKYEELLFPVLIICFALFFYQISSHFEKKAKKSGEEKEITAARSNVKILTIASIAMSALFGIMQCFILYGAYQEATAHAEKASVDIGKISCILMGLLFIILGNFMPKTRTNSIIGVRISWSMYNDTTWQKSNRFGGIALILTGILTILTAAILPNSLLATVLSLLYLTAATIVILIYAHGIYKKEKA